MVFLCASRQMLKEALPTLHDHHIASSTAYKPFHNSQQPSNAKHTKSPLEILFPSLLNILVI